MFVYGLKCVCHEESGVRYVGQTAQSLLTRLTGHRGQANFGTKTPVYHWMRKHGPENIRIELISEPEEGETLDDCEIRIIRSMRETHRLLNLAEGGGGRRGYSNPKNSEAFSGENHHAAKITDDDVMYIRKYYTGARGQMTELSKMFGLSTSTILDILSGRSWKHLPLGDTQPTKRPRTLKEEDIRCIRVRRGNGDTLLEIAHDYGVTETTIHLICKRKTWAQVS